MTRQSLVQTSGCPDVWTFGLGLPAWESNNVARRMVLRSGARRCRRGESVPVGAGWSRKEDLGISFFCAHGLALVRVVLGQLAL